MPIRRKPPAPDIIPPHVQLDRFCAAILEDVTLHHGLDAVEDQEALIALVLRMGQAHGFLFTDSDIRVAMQATRRVFCARLLV